MFWVSIFLTSLFLVQRRFGAQSARAGGSVSVFNVRNLAGICGVALGDNCCLMKCCFGCRFPIFFPSFRQVTSNNFFPAAGPVGYWIWISGSGVSESFSRAGQTSGPWSLPVGLRGSREKTRRKNIKEEKGWKTKIPRARKFRGVRKDCVFVSGGVERCLLKGRVGCS